MGVVHGYFISPMLRLVFPNLGFAQPKLVISAINVLAIKKWTFCTCTRVLLLFALRKLFSPTLFLYGETFLRIDSTSQGNGLRGKQVPLPCSGDGNAAAIAFLLHSTTHLQGLRREVEVPLPLDGVGNSDFIKYLPF